MIRTYTLLILSVLFFSCNTFDERRQQWKNIDDDLMSENDTTKQHKEKNNEERNDTITKKKQPVENKDTLNLQEAVEQEAYGSSDSTVQNEMVIVKNQKQKEVNYYVIVGSFANEQDAEKLYFELMNNGYQQTTIVYDNKTERYRVAIDSFKNRTQAGDKLNQVKTIFTDAWIFTDD